MDTTERNTGKVSPSTETNEVFSANTNNENTIGDEFMMDTTDELKGWKEAGDFCEPTDCVRISDIPHVAWKCEPSFSDMKKISIPDSNGVPHETMQTTGGGEPPKPSKQTPGFDFHAKHNNADCIHNLDPSVKGTTNEFWHTISMYVELFHESRQTIQNNINSLISIGELPDAKNFTSLVVIEDALGCPHKTTIYNLEVLNKLAMLCFKGNEYAQAIRNKFSDILTAYETGVSVTPAPAGTRTQFALPKSFPEALRALAAEVEAREEAERKLALSHQELDGEKEEHRHDNCVRNGRAGGLTKNRNFHQARADAAEARADEAEAKADEEKAKADELTTQLEIERGKWKTARDFCEPTRLNYSLKYLKWQVSRDLERVCEFLQEKSLLNVAPRPDGVMKFPKLAFDYLLHHFCVDPTYLKANRYDWLQELYKNGTISSVLGDPFAGEPDILKGLKHIDEETGKEYALGESVSEYRLHPHATSRYGVFKYNDESDNQ